MKFTGAPDGAGPVVFVLSATNSSKYSVVGHVTGLIRLVNVECLKVEQTYKVPVNMELDETVTAGVFNPNGINFAIGTSLGHIFLGSIKEDSQGKPKVSIGRIDAVNASNAVTSLQFSMFDPIGSFVVAFDNGQIRTWQSSVRNEQFMKLLEIQQTQSNSLPQFDLSECGYQQFDLVDNFDMFENPHGLDEVGEEEKTQLRLLY